MASMTVLDALVAIVLKIAFSKVINDLPKERTWFWMNLVVFKECKLSSLIACP